MTGVLTELGRKWRKMETASREKLRNGHGALTDGAEIREDIQWQLSEAWAEHLEGMPLLYTVKWDADVLEACTDQDTYGKYVMYGVCAELARACLKILAVLAEKHGSAAITHMELELDQRQMLQWTLPMLLERVRTCVYEDRMILDGRRLRSAARAIIAWMEMQGFNALAVLQWTLEGEARGDVTDDMGKQD